MNFKFNTGAERIAVLEDLRKPTIIFPSSWDPHRNRQRESTSPPYLLLRINKKNLFMFLPLAVIIWLLQHDPEKRPSAFELSQSPLLPAPLEDEYFKGALQMMGESLLSHFPVILISCSPKIAKPDSAHHQTAFATLFKQPPRPSRAFIHDLTCTALWIWNLRC